MKVADNIRYVSTRGNDDAVSSAQAIIQGLAPDKGLYVPTEIPKLSFKFTSMRGVAYRDIAYKVMRSFFTDFSLEELHKCTAGAYDEKFDTPLIAPIAHTSEAEFLELYHGRTAAFKDMALSILPYLLIAALRKERVDSTIAILTATSGDTGKAALEGFADVTGTEIIVFYPKRGVSEIQRMQMVTQRGKNTHVYGIQGNFDDAQRGVKDIFSDREFEKALAARGYRLSSANSINIGRLVPQVAYYIAAYVRLIENGRIKNGDKINLVVPTGNFGNILAGWYASKMGLPVNKLICASNENNVLTDFINTGVYDANRKFVTTSSPSMDILISSNLERLLWHLSGGDSQEIKTYMKNLERDGKYRLKPDTRAAIDEMFYGGYASTRTVHQTITKLWNEEHYLVDTHTAVGYKVYMDYKIKTGDDTPTLIASTASAYKFADKVAACLGLPKEEDGFAYINAIKKKTGVPIPEGLRRLDKKAVLHNLNVKPADMIRAVDYVLK
ncbi:MAG: threonine synthase [Clostridiales Family XIII bacterium]|jgi:threonine synthase|nr:threonine synthase [Clostridiales Family XIII bacterium]